jgi:hypothetical protein
MAEPPRCTFTVEPRRTPSIEIRAAIADRAAAALLSGGRECSAGFERDRAGRLVVVELEPVRQPGSGCPPKSYFGGVRSAGE